MATYRIGIGSEFQIKDDAVGVGKSTTGLGNLRIDGTLKASGLSASGVSTFITYSGFTPDEISGNITLTGEFQTTGDIVVGTGKTFTVSSGSTVDVGSVESVSIGTHFSPPTGGMEDRPEVPVEGTVRFNRDLNTLEFYNGVEWRQFTVNGQSGRGLFMGGTNPTIVSDIDYITIPTLGNSKKFGDLTAAFYLNAAFGSSIRGISGGAYPAPGTVIYEYVTIASEGNSISFGNLATNSVYGRGAASSSTRGLLAGYYPKNVTIEYVEIDTLGNGTDFADLTDARSYPGGMASPTRAVFAGGFYGDSGQPNSQTSRDTIDYVTIANKSNAVDFGNLTAHRIVYDGAAYSNTRGVITSALVYQGPSAPDYGQKFMDYVTIASTGNAIEFGETAGNKHGGTATSTQIRGVFMGGQNKSSPYATVNIIDYVTIATTGNSVDFGDMDIPKRSGGGTSDSHGGLGGY